MTSSSEPEKIRVALVEDEGLFRDLLRIVLSGSPRLEIVGAFGDAATALTEIPCLRPRVAILDIELGGSMTGIKLGLLLRQQMPEIGIVLLSNHSDPQFLPSLPPEAIAGWSYLLKKSIRDVESLERAIEGAAARFVVLDPQLARGLHPRTGSLLAALTPRQREVLGLIAEGYTNAAIAQALGLAEKSVENQVSLLYQQLAIDREDSSLHPRVKAVLLFLAESQHRWGQEIPT
jgi:DNA-binding NarL/FixJ family response regulator